MAEAILRHLSRGAVEVESAGSDPRAQINPFAREAVKKVFGLDMDGQRPKSVNDFVSQKFDYVITVCDRAAESCPTFPGAPAVVRWSLPDPAEAQGTEQEKLRAFENGAKDLMQRIRLWLALPGIAARIPSAPGRNRG